MLSLKTYYSNVKRILHWLPIIWKGRCWDYSYMLEHFELLFEEFESFYSNSINVHMIEASRKRIVKDLIICKNLIKRINTDEYGALYRQYLDDGFPHTIEFVEKSSKEYGTVYQMVTTFQSKEAELQYRRLIKKHLVSEELLRKTDLELFGKIISRKIRTWWD